MTPQSNWLHIAEQASTEMDPRKLMALIGELCQALEGDTEEKSRQQKLHESKSLN